MPTEKEIIIEQAIMDKGLNAPRVTPEKIDALHAKVAYEINFVDRGKQVVAVALLNGQVIASCIKKEHAEAVSFLKQLSRNALWRCEGYDLKMADIQPVPEVVNESHIQSLKDKMSYKTMVIPDTTTMHCIAFIDGFSVALGVSACVDPSNFNQEIGEKIAKENADFEADHQLEFLENYRFLKAKKANENEQ